MCDKSERRFLVRGEFAVRCEVDEAAGAFDFELESGQHEVVRFADATPAQVAKAVSDLSAYGVAVTFKGDRPGP
ncbi:MAG: hypothetical protein AB7O59_18695 [Pirellulales bacterium]